MVSWEVETQAKLKRQRASVTQLVWMAKSELTAYGTEAGTWKSVGLKHLRSTGHPEGRWSLKGWIAKA